MTDPYSALHAQIVSGDLSPGERLIEEDLAQKFGAGRAAIRTALLQLVHEGVVEHIPNRGARVRRVSEEEALEILEARAALEGIAAGQAAARATDAEVAELREILASMRTLLDADDVLGASDRNAVLHRRILEISGHRTAQRICANLNSQIVRFQYRTILVPGRPAQSFAEHSAVVDAIASGDAVAAEAAMRRHLGNVGGALRARSTSAAA